MEENKVYQFVSLMLEQESFEDLLERFDLTPEDAFFKLIEVGLIDEDVLEGLSGGLRDGVFEE